MLRNRNRLQSGFIGRAHRPPAAASPGSPLPSIASLSPRLQADGLGGSANGSASTGCLSVVLSPACSQQQTSPDAHPCAELSSSTCCLTPCPIADGRAGPGALESSVSQQGYQGELGQVKAATGMRQGVQQLGVMTKSPGALKQEAGLDADGSAALGMGPTNAQRLGRLTSKRRNKKKDAAAAEAARRDSMTRLASSGQDAPRSSLLPPASALGPSPSPCLAPALVLCLLLC